MKAKRKEFQPVRSMESIAYPSFFLSPVSSKSFHKLEEPSIINAAKCPSKRTIEIIQRRYPHCPKPFRAVLLHKIKQQQPLRQSKFTLFPTFVLSPHSKPASAANLFQPNRSTFGVPVTRNPVMLSIPAVQSKTIFGVKNKLVETADKILNLSNENEDDKKMRVSRNTTWRPERTYKKLVKFSKQNVTDNSSKLSINHSKAMSVHVTKQQDTTARTTEGNEKKKSIAIGTDEKKSKWF